MANKMADKKKNASQSGVAEAKARDPKSAKSAAQAREERRERENRAAKQNSKQSTSFLGRLRRNRFVAFFLEAYRELRYKVTWPTFQEARNMTFVVIALSTAVAAVLALADLGLFKLFQLISGQ